MAESLPAAEAVNERRATAFRTVCRIARGADSEVVLASSSQRTSPGTPRWVALKRLRSDRPHDAETREALRREIELARKLAHPRLPRVFAAEEAGRSPYIAQEYVDGPDLATLLLEVGKRGRRLDLRVAWHVMLGMAEALQFLHRSAWRSVEGAPKGAALLHGDLVADNVLVCVDGTVRLTDLGRAWFVGSDVEPPSATRGFTPALSPEQARGTAVDVQSDIFLFGALFYECLTGRHPFLRDTVHETAREVGRARPVPLERLRPVPPELAALVDRCLDVSPARRYESVQHLIAAMRGLQLPGVSAGDAVLAGEIASVFPGHEGSARPWVLRGGSFRPPFLPMVLSWLPPPIAGPESPGPALAPQPTAAQLGPDTGRMPRPDLEPTDTPPVVDGSARPEPQPADPSVDEDKREDRRPRRRKRRPRGTTVPSQPVPRAPRPPRWAPWPRFGGWARAGLAASLGAGLTALAFLLFVPRTPELRPALGPPDGAAPSRVDRAPFGGRDAVKPIPQGSVPAPPPVGAPVDLVIRSVPPGAQVTVDGQDVGLAPVRLVRPAGALLQVTLDADRHAGASRLLPVPDEGGEFTIRLDPQR